MRIAEGWKEQFQLQGQAEIAGDANAPGHKGRMAVESAVQHAQTIPTTERERHMRSRVHAFVHFTPAVLDDDVILAAIWATEVKLVHRLEALRCVGIQFPGQSTKELSNRAGFHRPAV